MSKTVSPIPPGFHSLTIHLNVDGAAKYLDFLKAAFGAEELHRSPGPGGKIMHATVKIGDSLMMIADDFCKEFNMPGYVSGNFPFVINLYVEDANAAWAKALAAGCEVRFPIADQFWGDRYGQVKDPAGFYWAIAQTIEIVPPEELQARAAKAFGGAH
jgi:PhnB protein